MSCISVFVKHHAPEKHPSKVQHQVPLVVTLGGTRNCTVNMDTALYRSQVTDTVNVCRQKKKQPENRQMTDLTQHAKDHHFLPGP